MFTKLSSKNVFEKGIKKEMMQIRSNTMRDSTLWGGAIYLFVYSFPVTKDSSIQKDTIEHAKFIN